MTYNEAAQALYGSKSGDSVKPSEEALEKIRRNLFREFEDDDNEDDDNEEEFNGDADDEESN